MKTILLAGLALASICSVNSYGPPPTKNKHRTTTTTLAPLPEANSPDGNSIYSTGPGIDQPSGCGSPGGGCGAQPQYPGGQTVQPGSGASSPSYVSTSSASGGSTYWWQGPNSPFNPNQTPGTAPVQPQYPGSNQPGLAPPAPHPPGSPGLNQPGSSYPGSSQPVSAPASQPIDVSKNPFLSSALGISKPSGCGSSSAGGCGAQPQYPGGQQTQPQYPGSIGKPSGCNSGCGQTQYPSGQGQPSRPQYPANNQGQPQYPGATPAQPQYPGGSHPQQPGSSPQYPGSSQGQPQQPGSAPQYPGSPQGQPQQPGSFPQYPGSSQGQPQQPGSFPQYPGSPQGQPQQPGSSPQYPGSSQGQPQQPGSSPQYPGSSQGQPQQPGSSPQYPGSSQGQPQYPGTASGQTPQTGYPQGGYPNYPGASSPQYPGTPSGQPQYPQYGSGSNSIPSGGKFPPPYPGANSPSGQSCNAPNHLCVAKSACYQGVLSQNGAPGRAGICNSVTEVCCRIPTNQVQGSQLPPSVGYGNGHRPGTNGIPIGGSIYDNKPSYVTPAVPVQPYTGPLNTTPYPGCPAALKCVSISYCTAEGVMSDSPVYLTREQQESRVPLTDCMNPDTNVVGKCCRDPNYKDPWPAGMMMNKAPTGPGGFDDGQYHPPEQEASNTFSHEAGIYYNVVSTTPKGHTIKKPIGNFNQKPTPFPTKPSVPVSPSRQPAPVYENSLPERGDTPESINTPSNEILPPQQGQPNTGYNQIAPSIPGKQSVTVLPQQTDQTGHPTVPETGPAYQPQSSTDLEQPGQGQTHQPGGQNTPTYSFPQGQTTLPNQLTLGQGTSGYPQSQSTPTQPGQPGLPTTGYQPVQSTPGHQGQSGLPSTGYQPNQSGQPGFPTTGSQPGQSIPGQGQPGLSTTGYQPGQPTIGQPGVTIPGTQPNQPGATGYQPGQTTVGQSSPTFGYQQPSSTGASYQPSGKPTQVTPGYQPTIPNLPDQPSQQSPSPTFPNVQTGRYPSDEENYSTPSLTTYTPRGHQAGQPSTGFVAGQIAPGSSCGVRHQAFSNNPEEAGITEFPWQALITSARDKKFLCGGAIVSENAVITAAHCIENFRAKDLVIKVGLWKLLTPNDAEQTRPVAAIARHPKYDVGSLAEDLAILVVSVSFTPTEHVDKICLPKTIGYRPPNNNCVVTGWGRPALKGPIPNSILHKVDVSFMDNARCEETLRATHLGKYFILNKGFSCALPKSTSDLCKVDVGGPLACDRGDGHYELAGVNSWDVGCPAEQTPTVFSNPDAEWIQNTINTPISKLEQDEEKYNTDKLKGESLDQVDIDQKPGFALGYGK